MPGTTTGGSEGSDETPAGTPESDEKKATEDAASEDKPEADQPSDADVDDSSDEPVAAPAAEQTEGETDPAEASEDEAQASENTEAASAEEEETVSDISNAMTSPNSLEQETKTKILIKGVALGSDGKTEELAELSTAEIQFTDGCASNDGTQVRADADITFRVLPGEGYKVASVKYGAAEKEEDLITVAAAGKSPSEKDGVYTIPKSEINKGDKKYNALIVVKTAETKFSVKAGSMSGLTLNTVEEKEVDGTTQEVLTPFTSKDFAYKDKIEFALSGMAAGTTYTVTAQADGGEASDPLEGTEGSIGENEAKKTYLSYSLDISKLDGIKENEDQNIIINVTPVAAVKISGTTVAYSPAAYTDKIAAPTIPADKTEDYKVYSESGSYDPGDVVVFSVLDPAEDSVWEKVTTEDIEANLVETATPTKVLQELSASESDLTAEGATVYQVAIPDADTVTKSCTLKIAVNAKMNDKAKKITFKLELPAADVSSSVVTIKSVSDVIKADGTTEYRTDGKTYPVSIESKEGYQLTDVVVKVAGAYEGTDGGSYDNGDGYTLKNNDEDDEDYPRYQVTADIPLDGTDDRAGENKGKKWIASSVEVTVKIAEVEGADEKKEVEFSSETDNTEDDNTAHPYEFKVDTFNDESGKVTYTKDNKTSGSATVAAGTKYLSFSVKAETEPEVVLSTDGREVTEGDNDQDLLELVGQEGGEFKYRVVAKAFVDTKGSITITRQKKTIEAAFGDNAVVTYKNAEDEEDSDGETATYELSNGESEDVDINAPLTVEVTRVEDEDGNRKMAPIDSVTYKLGEEGAEQQAQKDGDGGFFFETKASDDIEITVNNAAQERLFVNGKEYEAGSIVPVSYEEKVTACLKDKNDNNVPLLNATVYDGATLAQTIAKLNETGDVVTIDDVAKAERGQELTVTLLKKADRTAVSFTIVSDKAVEEVSYAKMDYTAVSGSVSLNADTSLELRVNSKDGTISKLGAAIVDTKDADPEKVPANPEETLTKNKYFSAWLEDGILTIVANPIESGEEKAGTIVLYELGDKETILKGSILNVAVKDPIMKGQTAKAEFKSATARDITIAITVPDEVKKEELNTGSLYYKLKVTKPTLTKPEGFTEDEWKETKQSIENNVAAAERKLYRSDISNGSYTIPLIGRNKKAAKIDGFKILVTPAQMVGKNEVPGTPCAEITAGTTAPVYTDTLKLKSGTKTLTTGQDADIEVAYPDFADIAEYKSVDVEMIDSTTGLKFFDEEDYRYYDFIPDWDPLKGAVTVNAGNASYYRNAIGDYKNLAVKITAVTESGDYGVSGIQKLSVINGIEDMTVSVQPEILKADAKKKVTAKASVEYNTDSATEELLKKCAPKKKAAAFSLVNVSAKLQGSVEINEKTGQITVAKEFVPSGKPEENRFQVRVRAADYDGNWVGGREIYSDYITVTPEDSETGELAVFEAGTTKDGEADWRHAAKVSAGDLQVKKTTGQYCLAMLKSNAPARSTYDLISGKDFVDSSLYTFKASGKSVEINQYGAIKVKKLGKVTFTMAAKSNTKNNRKLENVNFVAENTELYVKVTQYQDSTFDQKGDVVGYYNASNSFEVTGNTTSYFELELMKKVDGADGEEDYDYFALPNCAFSVKNGKKVTPVPAKYYNAPAYVMATGTTGKKATVITVTNKAVKPNKKIEITISNPLADKLTGTAPKITLTDKKQRIPAGVGGGGEVGLTVTSGKKGESLPDNAYVMLSVDQSKKTKANVKDVFANSLETAIPLKKTSSTTGTFSLRMTEKCEAESYSLIAVLGTLKDGVFTQTHKEARVTVKAVKGNINIKATSKYTLNPYGVSSQKLVVNGGDYNHKVKFMDDPIEQKLVVGNKTEKYYNYAKNVIQKDGNPNQFNKYFGVRYDDDGSLGVIEINPTLSLDELKNLENKDFLKANGTGYITLTNGRKVVDIKLTVAVNGKEKLKLKATAAPVLAGKDVITDVQVLDGKTPVALAAYTADGGAFKQYYNEELDKKKDERDAEAERLENGIIRMKAAEAAKGKDTLTLRVLPAGIAAAYGNVAEALKTYGTDITKVSVKIDAADKKNKISLSAADKKWKVESGEWAATAERAGWATEKAYTFTNRLSVACVTDEKDSGQIIKVTSKTPYVIFTDVTFGAQGGRYSADGRQKLEIFLDKAELDKAMTVEPKKVNWGKTVKVDAVFTYPDKADETKTVLAEDKVTFSITLPEKEGYASATELIGAIENAKADLKDLVDTRTTEYEEKYREVYDKKVGTLKPDGKEYTVTDREKDVVNSVKANVEADLEAFVLNMAKGTTAVIDVKSANAGGVYTYTLTVDGTTWEFKTTGQASAQSIIAALSTNGYLNVTAAEKAGKLGLSFKPAVTDDALTANLNKILNEELKVTTSNISVSAKVNTDAMKAPTTTVAGEFEATVTVIDRNYEPKELTGDDDVDESNNYIKKAAITYDFPTLKESSVYISGDESLKTKLGEGGVDSEKDQPAVEDMTKLDYLFSESYKDFPNGIEKNNTIKPEMKGALKEKIENYAKELIKANPYLSVKEIKEDFKCTYNVGSPTPAWFVEFTIVYTDESGEEPKDIEVALTGADKLTVTKSLVPRLQEPSALKDRAEAAFLKAGMLLEKTDKKPEAIAAVRAMIEAEDVCLNPNYNKQESLKVTAEDEDFVAPSGTDNGQITVAVDYDAKDHADSVTGEYTFVIVSDNKLMGNKPATDEDPNPGPNLDDADKYEGLVKAALSEARLNKLVQEAWKKFAKIDGNGWDEFITAGAAGGLEKTIETAAEKSLKGHENVVALASIGGVTVVANSVKPGGAASNATKGEIKAITVKVVTKAATPETVAKVTIPTTVLNPHEVFQSEDEFRKAVADDLTANAIDYEDAFFTTNADETSISTDANKTAVIDAITARAKAGKLATNPEWNQATYLTKIKAEAQTNDPAEADDTDFTSVSQVRNVKLIMGDAPGSGETDPLYERKINVKIKTKAQTDLIEDVKLTKIGTIEANATNGTGADKDHPIVITAGTAVDGDSLPLTVQKKLTSGNNAWVNAEDVTWTIKAVGDDGSGNETINNLTGGVAGIINKDGVLFIPQNAWAADEKILVKISVTVTDANPLVTGDNASNMTASYVEIKLPEKVDTIKLSAASGDVADALTAMTFEADATTDTTINFTASLKGSHIKDDTKAEIEKPANITDKVTFANNTANKSVLAMTIEGGLADEQSVTLNMSAGTAPNKKTRTMNLTISPNSAAVAKETLSFEPDGTKATWKEPEGTGASAKNGVLTVQNTTDEPVEILIKGADGRNWTSTSVTKNSVAVDGVSFKKVDEKVYLVVNNSVPEVKAEFTPETGDTTPAVTATTWKLTMISTADPAKGQAAITRELTFDVVVKRTIKKVTIAHKDGATGDTANTRLDDDGVLHVPVTSGTAAQISLEATLEGAHVATNSGVTWRLSKGSKSKAKIDADGVVTIPADSIDNIIKVTATTKDRNEDGNTVSGTYTIKVEK